MVKKWAPRLIVPMLCEMFDRVGALNRCFAEAESFKLQLKEYCIDGGIIIIRLLSSIFKFLREDMPLEERLSLSKSAFWSSLYIIPRINVCHSDLSSSLNLRRRWLDESYLVAVTQMD